MGSEGHVLVWRRYRLGLDEEDVAEDVLNEFEENQEESWTAVNFAGTNIHDRRALTYLACGKHAGCPSLHALVCPCGCSWLELLRLPCRCQLILADLSPAKGARSDK